MPEPPQVPKELHEDLLIIADKIEPYARMVVEKADQLEENAADLASKIEPAAEKLGAKMEQGAHTVRRANLGLYLSLLQTILLWALLSYSRLPIRIRSALHGRSKLTEPALAFACSLCCKVLCTHLLLVWRSDVLAHCSAWLWVSLRAVTA